MRQISAYAYANARIRAMLSRLIDGAHFQQMLDSKDAYELVEKLKNTEYRRTFESVEPDSLDLVALERSLTRYDIDTYRKVGSFLKGAEHELVILLLERYEIEALKTALRIWFRKPAIDPGEVLPSERIVYPIDYRRLIEARTAEEVMVLLNETPYEKPLVRNRDAFKEHDSLFYLEAGLDVDYYERILKITEKLAPADRKVASKIMGIEIDIENINWLIRMRKYYSFGMGQMLEWVLPGGTWIDKERVRSFYTSDGLNKIVESVALGPYAGIKDLAEKNIHLIEGFLYSFLLREIKKALAGFPFSIGTVLGYLLLKRRETRAVISLLNARQGNAGNDQLLPLLNL